MIISASPFQSRLSTDALVADLYPNAYPARFVGPVITLSLGNTLDFSKHGAQINSFSSFHSGSNATPKEDRIAQILGANTLVALENFGTGGAFVCRDQYLGTAAIDQFFSDLPPTTNGVIINLQDNPGSATCDPTIATAKGYTVIVD